MLILVQYFESYSFSNINRNSNNNLRFGGVWGYATMECKSSYSPAHVTNDFRDFVFVVFIVYYMCD